MIVITFSLKAHDKSLCKYKFNLTFLNDILSCLGNALLCTDESVLGMLYLLTSAAHLV